MKKTRRLRVGFLNFADAVLILAQFLRRHHATLVVEHHTTDFVSDVLSGLQHQLKVLQFVTVRWNLHKDRHARRHEIARHFRVEGARVNHVGQAKQRRAATVRAQVAMENIHVAKLEASLLNTVKQHVTVQMAAVMGGHVHDDHRFFTLRFFNNRFWLYNGLWLNLRCRGWLWCRLRLNRLLRRLLYRLSRLRLYRLLHGLLWNRLRRSWLLLNRLLLRLTHRLFHRLRRRLARLCRSIRRLILVLRSTGASCSP